MSPIDPLVCAHGSLTRSCDLCERDARIAELEAEIVRLQQVLDNTVEDYQLRLADAEARRESWRHVAAYYLGDYVDTHTPEECRREAIRRAVERR